MKLKLTLILACISVISFSCQKEKQDDKNDVFGVEDANLLITENGYKSTIVSPLDKPADWKFNTSGIIEYTVNGNVVAKVDFGSGEKDTWAKKSVNGTEANMDLTHKGKKSDYDKIIVKPLVKTTNCNYIVEGTIEYWNGGEWVATVDYGDGTCDDLATKTWAGGSKTFSLSK